MKKKLIIGFLVLAVLLSGCAAPKTTTTTPAPTAQQTIMQPAPTQTLAASPTQTLTASPTKTLTAQTIIVQ